jgi:hypothetical protein
MSTPQTSKELSPSIDEFAAMLNETLSADDAYEGSVVRGKVVSIEKDMAVIDVGLKSATRSKFTWSASRTRSVKRSSAATRLAAKRAGPVLRSSSRRARRSPV